MNESLVDRCERNKDRTGDLMKDLLRLEGELSVRDNRIKHNTELIVQYKDKVNTEIT